MSDNNLSPSDLRASANRAFWGRIWPSMRFATIKAEGGLVVLTVVLDEHPTDAIVDDIQCAGTEIISDVPGANIREEIIVSREFVPNSHPLKEGLFFLRAENTNAESVHDRASQLAAITSRCPLPVIRASFETETLLIGGENWALAAMAPWRVLKSGKFVFGVYDPDDHQHLDELVGQSVLGVSGIPKAWDLDFAVRLSRGLEINIFTVTGHETLNIRVGGQQYIFDTR